MMIAFYQLRSPTTYHPHNTTPKESLFVRFDRWPECHLMLSQRCSVCLGNFIWCHRGRGHGRRLIGSPVWVEVLHGGVQDVEQRKPGYGI